MKYLSENIKIKITWSNLLKALFGKNHKQKKI